MVKGDFGPDFQWGVSTAAFQTEGAWNIDGKGPSIWDVFTARKGKIKYGHQAQIACDFYHRYETDIALLEALHIPNFRFSIAWPRIFPNGIGRPNPKGMDFYKRVVDRCLERGITPWLTLYHWDLPQALQNRGGWANRDVLSWLAEYAGYVTGQLGDRVKRWMILNEPTVFTGAGYFFGVHAPGLRGLNYFFPAAHHAALAMGRIGRLVRDEVRDASVGTTFSCSSIHPASERRSDMEAAKRADALINRLFIEPVLGLGYPTGDLNALAGIEKYMQAGDEQSMAFDFDFIGLQNYTREVVTRSFFVPYLQARLVPAVARKAPLITDMGWEVYPAAIYEMIEKFSQYPSVPPIYITENGVAFPDRVRDGIIHDELRLQYLQDHMAQVLLAKRNGLNVHGYFVWTLTDNFEWAEGYHPRFGLVHVDFETQRRTVKKSGHWYAAFLSDE